VAALGAAGCVALLSFHAAAAHLHGAITGYTSLLNPVWEEGKDPDRHLFSFREPVPTVRAEFRRLYPDITKELCVVAIGAAAAPVPKPVLIRVGGGRTTPVTIVVPPGAQLQFQNTDPFAHRLYAVGLPAFSASDTVKGGVRSWSVPGPGTFEIRDEAAPSLRMWVVGEPNVAAIAYPSAKGEYLLSVDTPGEYKVEVFFAGKKVSAEVPVKVAGADIDLSKAPIKVVAPADKSDKSDKAADKNGKSN
jgi:hypothetical protein